jgi:D-alanyl-D-alanine dipeptidase
VRENFLLASKDQEIFVKNKSLENVENEPELQDIKNPSTNSGILFHIPVYENHEPFVNLRQQKVIRLRPAAETPSNPYYSFMRLSVYKKLLEAQKILSDYNSQVGNQRPKVYLYLYEAYRPLRSQKIIFDSVSKNIKKQHPEWSEQDVFDECSKTVCPVTLLNGIATVPPHSTGGAMDIFLVDSKGKNLTSYNQKKNTVCRNDAMNPPETILYHRKLLKKILEQVGLVHYESEHWHFSYGDRYWAFIKKEPFSCYESIPEDALSKRLVSC